MAKCRLDGKTYSLALVLPPAENAAGLEASKMYDCWTEQVRTALLAAKIKREQEKLAAAADEKGKEKEVAVVDVPMKEVTGGDAEGMVAPLASTEGTSVSSRYLSFACLYLCTMSSIQSHAPGLVGELATLCTQSRVSAALI
jgi:hypothetical protein